MDIDGINTEQLPPSREEAFISFEMDARISYEKYSNGDRDHNTLDNGTYLGSYEPERTYVIEMIAFLDEYNMDAKITDISELTGDEFISKFGGFKSKMTYMVTRYKLRKSRIGFGTIGTAIMIAATYKSEIGSHLETIRKIVNQEVQNVNKKDKIFSKIASLQSEIDREQTTIDALFGRAIALTETLGKCAENLEPAINKMERVKKLFWDESKTVELLTKQDRPKLILKPKEEFDVDDDIPF